MRSSEWISCFALLVHVAFTLCSELSLSEPVSSHTFTFKILSPIPPGECEQAAVWGLSCLLMLNHNKNTEEDQSIAICL